MASLAETLYHTWRRAQHDITEHPAWGNLESEQRLAWEALSKAVVDYPLDVIANLNTAIQKLQTENERLKTKAVLEHAASRSRLAFQLNAYERGVYDLPDDTRVAVLDVLIKAVTG